MDNVVCLLKKERLVSRVFVISDYLVALSIAEYCQIECFGLRDQRSLGTLTFNGEIKDVIRLKSDQNTLVTLLKRSLVFWTVPDFKIISQLQFEEPILSNVCELESGLLALGLERSLNLLLVSPQSMKVQTRVKSELFTWATEIRKNVVALSTRSSTVTVRDIEQNGCVLQLTCSELHPPIVKYAEGMFLVKVRYGVQGWTDKGECWLHIEASCLYDSIRVLRDGKVAMVTKEKTLDIYQISNKRW